MEVDHIIPRLASRQTRPRPSPPGQVVSRHADAYASMGICIILTTILLALRFRARLPQVSSVFELATDDFTALLGWMCITSHNVVVWTNLYPRGGLGVNIWDVSLLQTNNAFIQRNLASICLYVFAAIFIKSSLFSLYLRLFGPDKSTRYLIYGGITVCIIFYLTTLAVSLVVFIPPPDRINQPLGWVFNLVEHDETQFRTALARAVFGVISDIYLLVVPIWCITGLQLHRRQKWALIAVFMTGVIAIGCSIGTVVVRVRLATTANTSWYSLDSYILSSAEISAGIICCCLPVCAALLRSYASSVIRLSSGKSSKNSNATTTTISTFVPLQDITTPNDTKAFVSDSESAPNLFLPTVVTHAARPARTARASSSSKPYTRPLHASAEDSRVELARMRKERLRTASRNGEVSTGTAMAMALSLAAELDEWDSGDDEFWMPEVDRLDD